VGASGHPEWGRFSLGKTNPNFSHAGLEGTVATYYAAVNKVSGLTEADVVLPATRRFVAGVEQSVARYGDNTASFQTGWLRADDAGQALSYAMCGTPRGAGIRLDLWAAASRDSSRGSQIEPVGDHTSGGGPSAAFHPVASAVALAPEALATIDTVTQRPSASLPPPAETSAANRVIDAAVSTEDATTSRAAGPATTPATPRRAPRRRSEVPEKTPCLPPNPPAPPNGHRRWAASRLSPHIAASRSHTARATPTDPTRDLP